MPHNVLRGVEIAGSFTFVPPQLPRTLTQSAIYHRNINDILLILNSWDRMVPGATGKGKRGESASIQGGKKWRKTSAKPHYLLRNFAILEKGLLKLASPSGTTSTAPSQPTAFEAPTHNFTATFHVNTTHTTFIIPATKLPHPQQNRAITSSTIADFSFSYKVPAHCSPQYKATHLTTRLGIYR